MQYSYSRCQLPEGKLHWQEIIWKAIIREAIVQGQVSSGQSSGGAKVRRAIIRGREQSSRGLFSGEQLSSRAKFQGQSSKGAIFLGGNCLDTNYLILIYLIFIVHRNAHKNQFTKHIDSKCLTNTFRRIYTGKMCFFKKNKLDQKSVKITHFLKCLLKITVLVMFFPQKSQNITAKTILFTWLE